MVLIKLSVVQNKNDVSFNVLHIDQYMPLDASHDNREKRIYIA